MKIAFVEAEPVEQKFFERGLKCHSLQFVERLGDIEAGTEIISGFIYSPIDYSFLEMHPEVRFIATRSTTFDHIDLPACEEHGVLVSYVPSYGYYTVAEHTMALMLAIARRIREALEVRMHTRFSYESIRGVELRDKTLGIVGTGRIGMHVVPLAKSFGMDIMAYDIKPHYEAADQLGFSYVSMERLLRRSDVITLHTPATPENQHMLNRDTLWKCRRGVLIVNTARGELIDTSALLEALDAGIVGGVALDVIEKESVLRAEAEDIIGGQIMEHVRAASATAVKAPLSERIRELQVLIRNNALLSRKRVIFTPHCAFNTVEAVEKINFTTMANIRAFVSGKPINLAEEGDDEM